MQDNKKRRAKKKWMKMCYFRKNFENKMDGEETSAEESTAVAVSVSPVKIIRNPQM